MKPEREDAVDPVPVWATAGSGFGLGEILIGLADVQMRSIVTTRLAPAIYLLCVAGVAAINIYLAVLVFDRSVTLGLSWTLLVMPVLFLSGVVVVRVALEVILSIFRIVVHMETLMKHLRTLQGQTETIVDRTEIMDLPRIQFWRPRRKPSQGERA